MTTEERIMERMSKLIADIVERDKKARTPMERVRFYYHLKITRARYIGCIEELERFGIK